tara:strand:- start:584 stop:1072 length:489 start_codon:yes stop_codon:yes gene_type:complete
MKRILSMLVENKPGALARVVGLFHQRGYNIESLNVAPVFDGTYSRLTVTTKGTENVVEQITKQINKLIDVIKVADLTEGAHHATELLLLKFKKSDLSSKISTILKNNKRQIIEDSKETFIISIINNSSDIDNLLESIGEKNILEIVRSGSLGIHESSKTLTI